MKHRWNCLLFCDETIPVEEVANESFCVLLFKLLSHQKRSSNLIDMISSILPLSLFSFAEFIQFFLLFVQIYCFNFSFLFAYP